MASARFLTSGMKGLTPAVDPTQTEQTFALEGENFIFDTKGPKSSFGNRFLQPQLIRQPKYIQAYRFNLADENICMTIDGDAIWTWDEVAGGMRQIVLLPDTSGLPYRWTHGYLNGYIYLAHPITGILCYHVESGALFAHSQIGLGTPSGIIALCVNNGRVSALSADAEYWSAPADGLDFTPALGRGGFQAIGDRVSGSPITITSYSGGCLVWTTGGVMRSEFTGDAAVYRHREINIEYRPVNSFCVTRVDDESVIILDERGLFVTQGDQIKAYNDIFNEFLIGYINTLGLNEGNRMRVEWDDLNKRLYVSMSRGGMAYYDIAYVHYPPLDRWGCFNEYHVGIIPIQIKTSQRKGDYFGFVTPTGEVRYWVNTPTREQSYNRLNLHNLDLYTSGVQKPNQVSLTDQGTIVSSTKRLSGVSKYGKTRNAYYEPETYNMALAFVSGLAARIQFGLFRPQGGTAIDEMSEVINITIRSVPSAPDDILAEDWNDSDLPNADWNEGGGSEDWGFVVPGHINHQIKLISSLDGQTVYEESIPLMETFAQEARYYSCSSVGIWHKIEIKATQVGESFHIKGGELTAVSAGRLL